MTTDLTVAKTILGQMGGQRRLILMIGASHFAADQTSIQFSFKGSRKTNRIKISLNRGLDLYTMQFYRFVPNKGELIKIDEFEGVYNDVLVPIFEDVTGLYLTL